MRFRQKNNLVYLTYKNLDHFPEVVHGIFTRLEGWSRGAFASLNIGKNGGDSDFAVHQNRNAIAECLNAKALYFLSQVHGTDITVIEETTVQNGSTACFPESDGVISKSPGNMLVIQVADCQSVMLFDPVNRAVANIHSGWRGSINNIVGKCVDTMKTRFGSAPESLIAGIGPSLGPCCAEFVHYESEIPESFWKYRDSQNRFNFWQASHDQLKDRGVLPANIETSNICTKCNPHLFFSYRHAKTTGRFASVIGLSAG